MTAPVTTSYVDPVTGKKITPTPQKYTDPTGVIRDGYGIDGKTYKDPAGTQRIDTGSLVNAGGQTWIMTDNGGQAYGDYLANLYAQQTNDPSAQIAAARQNATNAAATRTDANVAAIEANRDPANAYYDSAARQNYISEQTGEKALANKLASTGLYNSGYSDTAKVKYATSYAELAAQNEQARISALRDLDNQIAQAKINGSADLADLQAQYDQLAAEQANLDRNYNYQQLRDNVSDTRYDNEFSYQKERDNVSDGRYAQEYADSRADVEWERQKYEQEAATQAQRYAISDAYDAADMGDFSKLKALGIDASGAEKLYALKTQAAYESLATSSGSSSSTNATATEYGIDPVSAASVQNWADNYVEQIYDEYTKTGKISSDTYRALTSRMKDISTALSQKGLSSGGNVGELYRDRVLAGISSFMTPAEVAATFKPTDFVGYIESKLMLKDRMGDYTTSTYSEDNLLDSLDASGYTEQQKLDVLTALLPSFKQAGIDTYLMEQIIGSYGG